MKIGDEVYVHGYIDEIRKDIVIVKNEGGYFGTDPEEITSARDYIKKNRDDGIRADLEAICSKREVTMMQIADVLQAIFDGKM